uniref:Peptidase M24 domain-containing protein n=1 Tax=Eutreptiella gymnastica TaxID=73025 RepID=A0A7S1I9H1_9EUGL
MRHIKQGMTEMHLEAMFKAWTAYHAGCRHMSYTCICGSGTNGAILHYGHAGRPNDRILEHGDMVVLDMGAEYAGYATDLTRSYPVSGKFTEDQVAIFNAVREAQEAVFASMKPGACWVELHRLSERVILSHLLKIGVVHNGTVEEMMAVNLGSVFMPHGLGHLVGLHVHDVGGYPDGTERPVDPGPCWLRSARPLKAGMVITVEPGCYFIQGWLDIALGNPSHAQYLNLSVLERFKDFGGVRLEDDVLVVATGIENFTVLPSTVEEIEAVVQSGVERK